MLRLDIINRGRKIQQGARYFWQRSLKMQCTASTVTRLGLKLAKQAAEHYAKRQYETVNDEYTQKLHFPSALNT